MPEYKHTLDPNLSIKMSVAIKRFVVIEPAGAVKNEVQEASHIADQTD